MKNILNTIAVLLIMLFALASCGNINNDSEGGKDDEKAPTTNTVGWKKGDLVYYRGDNDIAKESLKERFKNETDVTFGLDGGESGDKLFIVGEYDHEVSKNAYSKMERAFSESSGKTIFTIFTDGNSVAIAYESLVARYAAIDYFFDEYKNLDLSKSGVVASCEIDVSSYIKENRTALREEQYVELSKVLSTEAVNEIRKLYNLYDEKVYTWLTNLYAPDVGGFYYSESARDTIGFLPDLESTAQALIFMSDSGMLADYNAKYRYALPDDMREAILSFAKESHDPTDGYFYHEQWGKNISSNRRGRDLSWATRIISGFGDVPYYDTPNGVKGSNGAPGTAPVSKSLRATNAPVAVSILISTSVPAYLSDVELFKKHLEDDYDWENNSYKAGNAIESELGQIQNAGYKFTEALASFLSSKQKSNGLWEDEITYDSVNGLMKITAVYTSLKKEIPKADKAMESAMQMLKSSDKASHVCSVYNPWEAVSNILISVENVSGREAADALRIPLIEEADELISITFEKMSIFKKDDGGFSYYIKYSAANSQGSPAALEKSIESDVNATNICTNSLINAIFNVLGAEQVSRYTPADFAYLSDMLSRLGVIVKDEILPAEQIDFDEYDKDFGGEDGGVVFYPDDLVETVVGDNETKIDGTYKWYESAIVKNPDPDANSSDLVLYAHAKVDIGAEKSEAQKPTSTRFKIPNAGIEALGNCFVYDADMYFVPGFGKVGSSGKSTSDPILQLFFMTESLPCSSLNFSVYTDNGVDYVKIGENYAGLDGKESNIAGKIPMGKWVNIRVEFYKDYVVDEKGKNVYRPMTKIYVDGKFAGDCDATISNTNSDGVMEYYDRKIDQVSMSHYRFVESAVYYNNVLAERIRKTYVEGENPDAMIDPPIPDEEMRESYGFEDGLLNTSNVVNKVRVVDFGIKKYINASEGQTYNPSISYSITEDPANATNKVLKVVALKSEEFDKPSRTEVNLYNSAADGTDYTFSGDFYYDSQSIGINGDVTQLFFLNSLEGQVYSLRISAKAEKGIFSLSIIENNKASGDTGSGAVIRENIPCNEWFKLKVVFHRTMDPETCGASIYLNDELINDDESYKAAALVDNPVIKVALVHQKTNNSTVYLDDLSFKKSGEVNEYVESEESVASFTEGFNTKYVHSYSYDGTTELNVNDIDPVKMETLYTKFYLVKDPKDKDGKNQVLRAVNKNGGTNAGYTKVDISGDITKGDCYSFETKMYIENATAGYNITQIKFVDKNNGAALSLFVSIDKTTSNLKIATTGSGTFPAAGTNLLADSGISVGKSEWFTLRIEFYHSGKSATAQNTYVKLFVNDILAYDGNAYLAFGYDVDHVELVHYKSAKSSAVLFDDVYMTRSEKAYTKTK